MKNFMIILNVGIILVVASLFSATDNGNRGAKRKSSIVNHESKKPSFGAATRDNSNSEQEIRFLKEAMEASLMNREEGRIAEQRATTRAIKDYGTLMVEDHGKMLKELQSIANTKGIEISGSLGENKAVRLSALQELQGKEFDSEFIKMMTTNHKRDIKKFEQVLSSPDADIQVFATKYLPVLKSHLDKIQAIKNID